MTRGSDTAEFYLSCQWYADVNYITWNGIFYSIDNGKNLSVKHKTNWLVEAGLIFGDPTPGVLYQIPMRSVDTFGVSYDYGSTFEAKYFDNISVSVAGCTPGELYIRNFNLFRSTDFGDSFTFQSSSSPFNIMDVGVLPGEIFAKESPPGTNPLHLAYSNDFGQTFTVSDVTFPINNQYYDWVDISRGTEPGELYFGMWIGYDSIAIFHTFDYGQTVTLQSWFLQTTDEIFYTAGRTPGSFYIARREICGTPPCLHSCLWIFFSRDYGVTYTTYFHDLDSTYTAVTEHSPKQDIQIFPNPVSDELTVELPPDFREGDLILYDVYGHICKQTRLFSNPTKYRFSVRDLAPGIYNLTIVTKGGITGRTKVVISGQ